MRICAESQDPREIPEGRYDVVISPRALGELMNWLNYVGFSVDPYEDGRSFMSGRIGEKVMGDNISMWDDGCDPAGAPLPFDFEGVPRQRVDLIKNGVAKSVVFNTMKARKEKRASTGHAVPPGDEISAMPLNVFVGAGHQHLAGDGRVPGQGPRGDPVPLRQRHARAQARALHRHDPRRHVLRRGRQDKVPGEEPALHPQHAGRLLQRGDDHQGHRAASVGLVRRGSCCRG